MKKCCVLSSCNIVIFQRVAGALGISLRTVSVIKQRSQRLGLPLPPINPRNRKKPKTEDLEEPIKMEVRNTLYNMYKESKLLVLIYLCI